MVPVPICPSAPLQTTSVSTTSVSVVSATSVSVSVVSGWLHPPIARTRAPAAERSLSFTAPPSRATLTQDSRGLAGNLRVGAAPDAGARVPVPRTERVVAPVALRVVFRRVVRTAEEHGLVGGLADPLLDVAGQIVHAGGRDAAGHLAGVHRPPRGAVGRGAVALRVPTPAVVVVVGVRVGGPLDHVVGELPVVVVVDRARALARGDPLLLGAHPLAGGLARGLRLVPRRPQRGDLVLGGHGLPVDDRVLERVDLERQAVAVDLLARGDVGGDIDDQVFVVHRERRLRRVVARRAERDLDRLRHRLGRRAGPVQLAVDEDPRGTVDMQRLAHLGVAADLVQHRAVVGALVERGDVDADVLSVGAEVVLAELVLVLEREVAVPPELALLLGARRRDRRVARARVLLVLHARVAVGVHREVLEHEQHAIAVRGVQPRQLGGGALAVPALEVGEFDDRDLGVRVALPRVVGVELERHHQRLPVGAVLLGRDGEFAVRRRSLWIAGQLARDDRGEVDRRAAEHRAAVGVLPAREQREQRDERARADARRRRVDVPGARLASGERQPEDQEVYGVVLHAVQAPVPDLDLRLVGEEQRAERADGACEHEQRVRTAFSGEDQPREHAHRAIGGHRQRGDRHAGDLGPRRRVHGVAVDLRRLDAVLPVSDKN